jgi:hypothetical protein
MDRKWIGFLYFLAFAGALGLSTWSWQVQRQAADEHRAAVARRDAAGQQRIDMARRRADLESPGGRDAMVRDRGYIAADETLIDR